LGDNVIQGKKKKGGFFASTGEEKKGDPRSLHFQAACGAITWGRPEKKTRKAKAFSGLSHKWGDHLVL